MEHPLTVTPGPTIELPRDLKVGQIRKAVDWAEQRASELVELYYEQANVFSGIVGMYGAKALDVFSPYKKHRHPDIAQSRFPDLSLNGRLNPPPQEALESKGSTRPWAIQSHYDHSGWYIVWRYLVDPTAAIKAGRHVVIWRVDVIFLTKEDWHYERIRPVREAVAELTPLAFSGRPPNSATQRPIRHRESCLRASGQSSPTSQIRTLPEPSPGARRRGISGRRQRCAAPGGRASLPG
jgi:hypothetical protein